MKLIILKSLVLVSLVTLARAEGQGTVVTATPAEDRSGFSKPTVVLPIPDSGPNEASFKCNVPSTEENPVTYTWTKDGEALSVSGDDPASTGPVDFGTAFKLIKLKCTVKKGEEVCNEEELDVIVCPREYKITVQTFIGVQWVQNPAPFGGNEIFGGDDRGFALGASSRTEQEVIVIPYKKIQSTGVKGGSYLASASETRKYEKSTSLDAANKLLPAAIADTSKGAPMKLDWATAASIGDATKPTSGTWDGDYKVWVRFTTNATNPLVSGAPGITSDFTITIDAKDPLKPKYHIKGGHDSFPSYEVYINDQRIHNHTESGDLSDLFPPDDDIKPDSGGDITLP